MAISEEKTQKLVTFMHKNPLCEFELDFFHFFRHKWQKLTKNFFKSDLGACLHLYMKGMY